MTPVSARKRPHRVPVYTAGVLAIAALVATTARAQHEISAPMVREASVPKTSVSDDARALMLAAPMQVWSEGQPIRVKQDLKGDADLSPSRYHPTKQRDPLLRASQAALESAPSTAALAAPTVGTNIDGIGATGVLPPDTIGAVGPNHYIQMVNSAFAIYDKSGNLLAGPSQINSLWQGFGGGCQTDNDGDPVVRYDRLADRWLVSQFAIDKNLQCIAVSRGPDPLTSGWFLYAFETKDANNNPVRPDYPKIGVWSDGYYMSTQRGFPSGGLDVWAFERDRMLAGQPARQVQFSVAAPSIVLQPSDLDGPPPPAGTPNFFLRQIDGQRFTGQDRVEVFAFSVNWANPAASTFKSVATLPTAAFDSVLCNADLMGACVPQPGTATRLETLSVWPMFRAQYRNFGTHQTLLLNHSVDATGHDLAGVRWYELRRPPNGTWSIFQQGTHAPDALNRWMGSLAMDAAGNIMVGYSVANAQTFPGLRIAYRRSTDPAGTLGSETTIVDGGGSETYADAPRWGDYGSMDVDPSRPCTFWYTSLYYATTSQAGWSTRIAEVRLPADVCESKFEAVYTVGDNGSTPPNGIAGYDLLSPADQVLKFDYDGDHNEDLFLYRPGKGAAWVAHSNGDGTFAAVYNVGDNGSAPPNGIAGYDLLSTADRVLKFDYNGDGKEDLFLYRPGKGAAWVARSNGDGTFTAVYSVGDNGSAPPNGIAGYDLLSTADQVLAFDYNGDGKDDLFVYRPGKGAAWVAQSNGDGTFTAAYHVGDNGSAPPNGIAGYDLLSTADHVLKFDYNGDGKEDLFLYRPGKGAAWVARSNGDGTFTAVYSVGDNGSAPPNGIAGYDLLSSADHVLTFDYNGDGKSDLFLYRPGKGAAWVVKSKGD